MRGSVGDSLELTVDLPPVELSPNSRAHRMVKQRATREYRDVVGYLAIGEARRVQWVTPQRARVSFLWGLRDHRSAAAKMLSYHPEDPDNAVASLKALLDGLRDARVIRDDRWSALQLGSVDATFEDGPWVRVRVERLGLEDQ